MIQNNNKTIGITTIPIPIYLYHNIGYIPVYIYTYVYTYLHIIMACGIEQIRENIKLFF